MDNKKDELTVERMVDICSRSLLFRARVDRASFDLDMMTLNDQGRLIRVRSSSWQIDHRDLAETLTGFATRFRIECSGLSKAKRMDWTRCVLHLWSRSYDRKLWLASAPEIAIRGNGSSGYDSCNDANIHVMHACTVTEARLEAVRFGVLDALPGNLCGYELDTLLKRFAHFRERQSRLWESVSW